MNETSSMIRLGTAKIDITPAAPMTLAGFASRVGTFTDVAHRLFARFFWLESAEMSTPLLIVCADLICWGTDRMPMIRRQLEQRFGLKSGSIIMQSSHTHSGPQTSAHLAKAIGTPSIEYLEWLELQVLEGAAQAAANVEAVHISRGASSCDINIHRRKLIDGLAVSGPNANGPVDRDVTVISFAREDGSLKAVWSHYACHPTISNRNEVSSEFCGYAMDQLEAEWGNGVVCGYLQGCCGDVRPNLIQEGKFVYGDRTDIARLGEQLASAIRVAMDHRKPVAASNSFQTCHATISLKLQPLPAEEDLLFWQNQYSGDILGEWSSTMLAHPERFQGPVVLDLVYIRIADQLGLLALNGEVVAEYGLHVKRLTEGAILPIAYSNGMIGYVPTARQVHEGGYEGATSFRYFGMPGPFDRGIEQQIQSVISELLKSS